MAPRTGADSRCRSDWTSLVLLSVVLVLQYTCAVAKRDEIESIEQVDDLPPWIAEELDLSAERGVYTFVRYYETMVRTRLIDCNRVKLSILDKRVENFSIVLERQFGSQMDAAIRSASLFSSLFQTRRLSVNPNPEDTKSVILPNGCGSLCDDAYYYTVARAFVESDERVLGFGIAFATQQYVRELPPNLDSTYHIGHVLHEFYPYAYRNVTNRRHILVMDASRALRYTPDKGQYAATDWYSDLAPPRRNYTDLFRRTNMAEIFVENMGESFYKVKPGGVVFASRNEARWSVPYYDCRVTSTWKATYSVPFFDANENFKGVVTLDVALDDVDIDQCASASEFPLFGATNKCKQETTDCVPLSGRGFQLGMYECRCRAGFYFKASPSPSKPTADSLPSSTSALPLPSHSSDPSDRSDSSQRRRRRAAEPPVSEPLARAGEAPYRSSNNDENSGDDAANMDFSENAIPPPVGKLGFQEQRESSTTEATLTDKPPATENSTPSQHANMRMITDMFLEIAKGTGNGANVDSANKVSELDIMSRANANANFFPGWLVEYAFSKRQYAYKAGEDRTDVAEYDVTFQCLPCKVGCDSCVDDTPCLAESNMVLRGVPLAFQSFFVTICCLVAVLVFRLRKTKLMRSSTWLLQELILLGGVLIYFTIFVMYFEASLTTCMTQPWFRQIGFALVYGSILLRLYRILVEHQSRNARRVHLGDRDMLKYVVAIVAITAGYMLIWTSVNVDQFSTAKLLQIGSDGVSKYLVCKACWWDYLVELGELLFVAVCIYLCYCARACPAEFGEVRLITVAVCNEALLSGVFHLSRHFFWLTAHPDALFLAYFVHCHLTITVTLCLIVGSRVWFAHVQAATAACTRGSGGSAGALLQPSHTAATRTGSSALSPTGPSSNGELDNGDANLSEMDADEVRAELRRVYMQLQVYKHKAMRKDNPHIAKRGKQGKCDRRPSTEPGSTSASKRGVASRTPEESTASNDRAGAD